MTKQQRTQAVKEVRMDRESITRIRYAFQTPAELFLKHNILMQECIRDNMYFSIIHWAKECFTDLRTLNISYDIDINMFKEE